MKFRNGTHSVPVFETGYKALPTPSSVHTNLRAFLKLNKVLVFWRYPVQISARALIVLTRFFPPSDLPNKQPRLLQIAHHHFLPYPFQSEAPPQYKGSCRVAAPYPKLKFKKQIFYMML
jgi:hypothetical protein